MGDFYMSIVSTDSFYNSNILKKHLIELVRTYPFLNIQKVGYSILGIPIYVIKLGKGPNRVFYSASIHANESITTNLLMNFIEDYCISYTNNSSLYGYSVKSLFDNYSIYIMPMVNPDGVNLVNGLFSANSQPYENAKNISLKYPSIPFPNGWKANIRGVDLKNYQPFCKVL